MPARVAASLHLMLIILMSCACQTGGIERREDNLAAVEFVVRRANAPERDVMLKRLPPNHFVTRASGNTGYVYAEPLVCSCFVCRYADALQPVQAQSAATALGGCAATGSNRVLARRL